MSLSTECPAALPSFRYPSFIYTPHHFTPHGRYEVNKLTSFPMCGFIAEFVQHCTGIAEVTGLNPIEGLIFFQASFQLLKLGIFCDDHSSLSFTTAVQIWIISYILHIISLLTEDMNSINWPRSHCVASWLSLYSTATVSQRSQVWIPLKG